MECYRCSTAPARNPPCIGRPGALQALRQLLPPRSPLCPSRLAVPGPPATAQLSRQLPHELPHLQREAVEEGRPARGGAPRPPPRPRRRTNCPERRPPLPLPPPCSAPRRTRRRLPAWTRRCPRLATAGGGFAKGWRAAARRCRWGPLVRPRRRRRPRRHCRIRRRPLTSRGHAAVEKRRP